jgi:gluconate kinase
MYYRKSNTRGKEQVQDCIDWLNLNAHELPSELENEKGESSGHTVMVNVGTVEDRIADIAVADASREDDRVGLYFREGIDALNPRMSTFSTLTSKNATDKQLRSLLLAAGFGTESVQNFLAAVKAESYQRYAIKQAKGLRWRGMQEYNGVTRAIEEEAKGLKLKPAKSGAKPMPPSERLNELLSYDSETGSLVWKVSRGRVKAGSVAYRVDKGLPRTRVDGTDYYTARIIWAMVEGDPLNNTVVCRDKDALNLRWSNLNLETTANSTATGGTVVRERSMMQDKYRAEIRVSAKQLIVIGYFDTEEEAIAAKILFINTCKR